MQKYVCTNKKDLSEFEKELRQQNIENEEERIDNMNKNFTNVILNVADKTIKRNVNRKKMKRSTPWWNSSCSKAVAERRVARRKLERQPTPANLKEYKEKTIRAKEICQKSKSQSFQEYIAKLQYDTPSKEVWQKLRAINSSYIPQTYPLLENNELFTDPEEKANCLLREFISSAKLDIKEEPEDLIDIIENAKASEEYEPYNTEIKLVEVENVMNRLKNTAPGLDGIPNALLGHLPDNKREELVRILNKSFESGYLPLEWKTGAIVPILKPGKPPEKASSYRPITLLSTIGKIMERVIQRRLEYVVEVNNVLLKQQSGFRRGQGVMDILLRVENHIRQSLQEKEICLVIYMDLENAFNKIWGRGLIYKVAKSGIKGKLLKWLDNYFEDRKATVRVDGYYSHTKTLEAGVPQGGVCSPTLFNLMLMDIPQNNVKLHIYADDITITSSGKKLNMVKHNMQQYLDQFEHWCEQWGVTLNPGKTYYQMYTRKRIEAPICILRIEF